MAEFLETLLDGKSPDALHLHNHLHNHHPPKSVDSEDSDNDEFAAPHRHVRSASKSQPALSLAATRVIVASLFLPVTVTFDPPSGPSPTPRTLERRKSVSASERSRYRRKSLSTTEAAAVIAGPPAPAAPSNRSPSESTSARWKIEPCSMGNVGLQNAVASVKHLKQKLWVGMLGGVSTDAWDQNTKGSVQSRLVEEHDCSAVFLTDDEVEGHYNQFCKQVLWKPFHYQLPDYPKGQAYEELAWRQYVAVNQKFANTIAENHKPGDIVQSSIATLRDRYSNRKLLIGRDKNDYVKGVRQKFLAYERFLKLYPEWLGKVVLIQVALSTTEANEMESRERVGDVVARINSTYGNIGYSPVIYLQQDIEFADYLAMLSIADACIITSLRDGMNLTSHEYVVCQEGKHGPLIISEFAGTYSSFGAALRVNPWDTREVADAIHEALLMSDSEKQVRWKELYAYISSNTAQQYVESFTSEVLHVHEELAEAVSTSIPPLPADLVYSEYTKARKRVFFLDQDGTIMTFNRHSSSTTQSISSLPCERVYEMLRGLVKDKRNLVYVMSGRSRADLEDLWQIEGLGICAENGSFLKYADRTKWDTMLPDQDLSWRRDVLEIFEYYTDRTPGSYIEEKETSIVWHYGRADLNFSTWQAAECHNHIEQSLGPIYPIHTMAKKRSVEVMPRNINKGIIIRRVLEHHQAPRLGRRGTKHGDGVVPDEITGNGHQRHGSRDSSADVTPSHSDVERQTSPHRHSHPHIHTGHHHHHPPSPRDRVDYILCIGDDRTDEYMFEYLRRLEAHSIRRQAAKYASDGGASHTPSQHTPTGSGMSTPAFSSSFYGSSLPSSAGLFDDMHGLTIPRSGGVGAPSDRDSPPLFSPTGSYAESTTDSVVAAAGGGDDTHSHGMAVPIPLPRPVGGVDSTPWLTGTPIHASSPNGSPTAAPMQKHRGDLHHHLHHHHQHHHHHHHHHHHTPKRHRNILTATVGRKSSAAKWFVSSPYEVVALLEALAENGGSEEWEDAEDAGEQEFVLGS
ncbi:hypothetical protein HK104_009660 [Borealophlyctis nickersoniae]|nr:hypothetical protein HK104_009660 [Borealophlyctis nickersoniae]